jgi:hypothetical protein
LVADGELPFNCADVSINLGHKLMVLSEEHGEVARAAYEAEFDHGAPVRDHLIALRTELTQLAAVACAWAEAITEELEGAPR